MENLTLHHVCIQTDCYDSSVAFYCDLLDMEVLQETRDFHGRAYNTWLKNNHITIELQTAKGDSVLQRISEEHTGLSHICFWVTDIEGQLRALQSKGFKCFLLHHGETIYSVNGGRLFKLLAPEGTIIEFRDKVGC